MVRKAFKGLYIRVSGANIQFSGGFWCFFHLKKYFAPHQKGLWGEMLLNIFLISFLSKNIKKTTSQFAISIIWEKCC